MELEWVSSHPAMLRGARQDHPVQLTKEDIVDAPSQIAVTTLQANVNSPKTFLDRYHESKKRSAATGSGEGIEAGLDLSKAGDLKMVQEALDAVK